MQVLRVEIMEQRVMMNRVSKQIIEYINDMEKKAKQMSYLKHMKKEVEINGGGTNKYRIKYGPNKGVVVR